MDKTLHNIIIIEDKYIEDSIATKKTPILTKNPMKGGNPAIDNKTIEKINAATLLDLFNKDKSDKSLLFFFIYLVFCLKKINIDHRHIPAII